MGCDKFGLYRAAFCLIHLIVTAQMKTLELFPARDNGLVMVEGGQVVTTSLRVAEYFGKDHKSVLRQINYLECSNLFRERNFAPSEYKRKNGNVTKSYPMYYLTRDGFTFLAMGFTGKIAAKFKEAYINAFNEMEELLRTGKESKYAEMIFKKQIEKFNVHLKRSIAKGRKNHGENYGPAGDLMGAVWYLDNSSFEENMKNVFAQITSAYLDGYFFVSEMQKNQKKMAELRKSIGSFTYELQSRLGL